MSNALTNNPRRTVFLTGLALMILLIFLMLSNMTAFSGEHRYQIQRSSLHSYGSSLTCDEEKNVGKVRFCIRFHFFKKIFSK